MSAYDNDLRVTDLSDEDFILFVVDDGRGNRGRVECSAPLYWSAGWNDERMRDYSSLDEAIRSLIGAPQ